MMISKCACVSLTDISHFSKKDTHTLYVHSSIVLSTGSSLYVIVSDFYNLF